MDLSKSADLPVAMRFRNLSKQGAKHLNVYFSSIHGRGLFTSKDIECGDMIIEYAGEVSLYIDIKLNSLILFIEEKVN